MSAAIVTFKLETDRLTLREMTEADAADMVLLNSNPEVVQYTGDGPFENIDAARNLVRNYRQYKDFKRGRWLMHLKDSGEFVGWCGLKFLENENQTDLGYRLLKKHWGKGYATEASRACLDYGFKILGLEKIIARAMEANLNSIKIMQKLGMQPEPTNAAEDDACRIQYFITKEEWLKNGSMEMSFLNRNVKAS